MASASVERMTTLSQEIGAKTKVVTDYLTAKGLDAASFDVNGLAEFPIPPEEEEVYKARMDLISLTKELHDIALGSRESVRYLSWNAVDNLSLQAMWEFKVAQAVPLDGMISYTDLAAKVRELNNGLDTPVLNLRRLIRQAMTNRIFVEPKKGFVAHTRSSRLLLEDVPMQNWVGFFCSDLALPIPNVVNAMKKWPGSEESSETSVNLIYNQDLPWYDFIQLPESKGIANRYNLAMGSLSGGEGYSVQRVIEGYPWERFSDGATVVDMGGNRGHVSIALAEQFPKLKFVVQDTAGMRKPDTTGTVPEELQSRVELTIHDFFTPQTVVAEAYFFRMIFHGFSDKYCVQILKALVPALRKGAKVILNDGGLSEPGTSAYIEEKAMRTMDMFMQTCVNAREREPDDWRDLFQQADARYKVLDVWRPAKSRMWFVEAEWADE